MRRHVIVVRAVWDPEANVWVATSEDLPGLVTEAETQERLVEKLHALIPDLLEDREAEEGDLPEVPVMVMTEQLAKVRLRS
jgi:predicted RNase H-like HicB family nuclease